MSDTYNLKDALMGGPGLDGYIYNAEVFCIICAREIIYGLWDDRKNEPWTWCEFSDSDSMPQPIFFGESDESVHCCNCGEYMYGPEAVEVREPTDTELLDEA